MCFVYNITHFLYDKKKILKKKEKLSEDHFCSLQIVFVSLPIYPYDAFILLELVVGILFMLKGTCLSKKKREKIKCENSSSLKEKYV